MKNTEAKLFSNRLNIAIERAGWESTTARALQLHFNRATAERGTIGIVTARRWLGGKSIPMQARLAVLARSLNVSAGWLRFGIDNVVAELSTRSMRHQRAADFCASIGNLRKDDLVAVSAMVSALLRLQKNSYFGLVAGRPSAGRSAGRSAGPSTGPEPDSQLQRSDAAPLRLVSSGR